MGFQTLRSILNKTVIVSGLGYFVDIYDLILFSIVSLQSLIALGITDPTIQRETVAFLLNWQMGGMLLGGILWGILGDKRGRLSVLFGSIALYSLATLANAFVTNIPQYAALRFLAGVGLAGELGAAVTLVSEVMTKETRGYGTSIVASLGIMGAVVGGFVARAFDWQVSYVVGGVLGLVLLITRLTLAESGMFKQVAAKNVVRGDFFMLFNDWGRFAKFVRTILIGLPIWCIIGIFITLSPFLARDLGVAGAITPIYAVMWAYAGASLGGLMWGVVSQQIRSRRNAVIAALSFTSAFVFIYFFGLRVDPITFYLTCAFLGFGAGYWSVFVTMAAEQFGTNLRATVATTVPNFIRGSTVPLLLIFNFLGPSVGLARSAMLLGAACVMVALFALRGLPETFGKNLDYLEGAQPSPVPANGRLRRRAVTSKPTLTASRAS